MALLEVKNLGISFGGLRAVNAFDIQIEKGPRNYGEFFYLRQLSILH